MAEKFVQTPADSSTNSVRTLRACVRNGVIVHRGIPRRTVSFKRDAPRLTAPVRAPFELG